LIELGRVNKAIKTSGTADKPAVSLREEKSGESYS
jgi:hypothetical protein